ncbi:MAG: ABC transporter substrate-binding protein [Burkholderiaceae bacterium]|nr:ABC transporter substrate-binding protein [Burkholderiaceae bacterium]
MLSTVLRSHPPRLKWLRLWTAAITLAAAGVALAQAATAPDAMVRDLTVEVLDTIRTDKGIASGDIGRVQKLVDEKILPYVDFQKMTQLAAAGAVPRRSSVPP